ncbi:MAG: SMI1/KNR4 family protein [Planctomycetia bacterium]|nr:SMI1/KNR4 family protein [Planctomycetia bacterium]
MDSTLRHDVLALLERIQWPPGTTQASMATRTAAAEFSERLDVAIPDDVVQWLTVLNGARIGRGGVFGIRPDDDYCDIEAMFNVYPGWKTKGWIPIAGDGCGNYYVIIPDETCFPVCFVDTMADSERPTYVVASGTWQFLRFLFEDELHPSGWPFDRAFVLSRDPEIQRCTIAPLPWNA